MGHGTRVRESFFLESPPRGLLQNFGLPWPFRRRRRRQATSGRRLSSCGYLSTAWVWHLHNDSEQGRKGLLGFGLGALRKKGGKGVGWLVGLGKTLVTAHGAVFGSGIHHHYHHTQGCASTSGAGVFFGGGGGQWELGKGGNVGIFSGFPSTHGHGRKGGRGERTSDFVATGRASVTQYTGLRSLPPGPGAFTMTTKPLGCNGGTIRTTGPNDNIPGGEGETQPSEKNSRGRKEKKGQKKRHGRTSSGWADWAFLSHWWQSEQSTGTSSHQRYQHKRLGNRRADTATAPCNTLIPLAKRDSIVVFFSARIDFLVFFFFLLSPLVSLPSS
ncbi:hypothetical protein B0J18DRAFT_102551 [Chaetomium sp. MPI-SDFR-AT-0129]|nr:hypothetical protein B0J18DRAFT_102551 [Chaetomium sp. MPI-SDFR-AT-0129]